MRLGGCPGCSPARARRPAARRGVKLRQLEPSVAESLTCSASPALPFTGPRGESALATSWARDVGPSRFARASAGSGVISSVRTTLSALAHDLRSPRSEVPRRRPKRCAVAPPARHPPGQRRGWLWRCGGGRPATPGDGHRRIARAIRDADPAGAARAARRHIALVADVALLTWGNEGRARVLTRWSGQS